MNNLSMAVELSQRRSDRMSVVLTVTLPECDCLISDQIHELLRARNTSIKEFLDVPARAAPELWRLIPRMKRE